MRYEVTRQQKGYLLRYLRSIVHVPSIERMDHMMSFLVTVMVGLFSGYTLYQTRIVHSPGSEAIRLYAGIISIALSGVMWSAYKYAQYESRLYLRIMTATLAKVFLNALGCALLLDIVAICFTVLTFFFFFDQILRDTLLKVIIFTVFLVGSAVVGYKYGRSGIFEENSPLLSKSHGRQKYRKPLDQTKQRAPDLGKDVLSLLRLRRSRIPWSVCFVTTSIVVFFGLIAGVFGSSYPFGMLFGQPVVFITITLSMLLGAVGTMIEHHKAVLLAYDHLTQQEEL